MVPNALALSLYIYICCRKGIWSHFGSKEGGFGLRGASRLPFERFRACFLGGFVLTEWRAQIAIFPPRCARKWVDFLDHPNWVGEEIRKFRLSVFGLFGVSGPQIGNQIEDMFLYTFGVGASSVRLVFGHATKPLVL